MSSRGVFVGKKKIVDAMCSCTCVVSEKCLSKRGKFSR